MLCGECGDCGNQFYRFIKIVNIAFFTLFHIFVLLYEINRRNRRNRRNCPLFVNNPALFSNNPRLFLNNPPLFSNNALLPYSETLKNIAPCAPIAGNPFVQRDLLGAMFAKKGAPTPPQQCPLQKPGDSFCVYANGRLG